MSELKLSTKLVQGIQGVVIDQDERARDVGVLLQYLAAVMGYLMGNQNTSDHDRQAFMDELKAFAQHVMDDCAQQQRQRRQAPQEAFGYWDPNDQ